MGKRVYIIRVRLTLNEKEKIDNIAKFENKTLSDLIRDTFCINSCSYNLFKQKIENKNKEIKERREKSLICQE